MTKIINIFLKTVYRFTLFIIDIPLNLGLLNIYLFFLKIFDFFALLFCGLNVSWIFRALTHQHKKNDKIKIVFFVHRVSIFSSFDSIIEEMMTRDNFEILLVLMPDVGLLEGEYFVSFEEKLKSKNIPFIKGVSEDGNFFDIIDYSPDYVFLQTPYYQATKKNPYFSNFLWFFTNVIHIPYAYSTDNKYHITHWDKNDRVIHRAKFNFIESEGHLNLYRKYSRMKDKNVIVMGYPKFDQYLKDWNFEDLQWKIKDKNVKRILWTPHYTVASSGDYIVSDFLNYFDYFLKKMKNNLDFQIILKPHPYLFKTIIEEKIKTTEELDNMIYSFNSLPNAHIYSENEYYGLFVTSDICVNESVSFIAEYLPSGHPMILLVKEGRSPFGEIGEKIADIHYIAHNTNELDLYVDKILIEGIDEKKIERKTASGFYTPINKNLSISKNICNFLEKI